MNVRYRKSGTLYIPQRQLKDDSWVDFKVKDVFTDLKRLTIVIAGLNTSNRWGRVQWHLIPNTGNKEEDMSLVFTDEMCVMAFLGAAKSFFSGETKELNL